MEIQIGNKKIGLGQPTFIIAELSCNHLQDYDLAVKTIEAMKDAGADAVKLQTYTPDTITLDSDNEDFQIKQGTLWDGQTLHSLYQKTYTPWEWTHKLKKHAEDLGMILFSAPFDKSAVDFLEALDIPAYKIASPEITDIPLIKYAASKGKPMIISTGIAIQEDIEKAVEACRSVGNNQIALLKCTSSYPTPYEEANLRTIPDLAERFGVVSGLSDHTNGITSPVTATALGASIIEKHFILDRNLKDKNGEYSADKEFSLNPYEFKSMADSVRQAEKALGKSSYDLSEKSKKSREFSRSLYIAEDVEKGDTFTEKNVRSVRPGFGLHPENLEKIFGKKANKDVKKGSRMDWKLIDD
jgi:pseudaminic acid synthase